MFCRPGAFCADNLCVERDSYPAGDLVLEGEKIAQFAVEPLGPEMGVGIGSD